MKRSQALRTVASAALVTPSFGSMLLRGASAQGTASTVRFASVGGISDAGLYLAHDSGAFRQAGVTVEMGRMDGAPSLLAAVATNQIDVAGISITPGLYASVRQGVNLRVVGDKQSVRRGFSATRLLVRSDLAGGLLPTVLQRLRGKTIAISAKPSMVYMMLDDLLRKHGMSLDDVRVVELAYPNMLGAFAGRAIDAAIDLEPFLTQAVQNGSARMVSDLVEVAPADGASLVALVYSERFAKDRAAGEAFMTAYMRGVRIYNDAFSKNINRERTIRTIARAAKVDEKIVRDGYPAGLDPNQHVSLASLSALQGFFVQQRFLQQPIDVGRIVDQSFADAAVRELGHYH